LPNLHPIPTRRSSDLVQAYTGAATTATIKDGLAPFAHHGHRGFPDFRTTNGLDGHLGPATTSGERPYGLDLVWDCGIVDDRLHADRKSTRLNSSHGSI